MKLITTPDWLLCSDCGAKVSVAIEMGQPEDFESATANICAQCLGKAVELMFTPPFLSISRCSDMTREECAREHAEVFARCAPFPTPEARAAFESLTVLAWQRGYMAGVDDSIAQLREQWAPAQPHAVPTAHRGAPNAESAPDEPAQALASVPR